MLGTSMRQALEMVREAVGAVRSYHGTPTLTVGATLACSYFWLLPKLPKFREQLPDLKIRLITQDDSFDLGSGELDVVLRFGIPPFSDGQSVASANEQFFPVCSPAFAERLKRPLAPRDLLALPLIGCDAPDTSWMFWPDWFERVGLGRRAPATALQFNHYTDGIAAALAGQGVALGWDMILGDLLASGQLVCLGEKVAATACYNAVVPHHRAPSSAAEAFVQWIGRMFAETASRQ
jgi:DNA-binding transcriptional LysR family regulator